MGAAEGLAVDGDGPSPADRGTQTLPVGQPGADGTGPARLGPGGPGAADGGLGRDGEAAGGVVAGTQPGPDRLGRIGGPFGDRSDRPRPGQHRGGRRRQDGDQRVAAPTGRSRIGNGGEVGQQVRGFSVLELAGTGVGEVGERGWDRG
jgi:hypothetical protein